jgi:YfiH family protein
VIPLTRWGSLSPVPHAVTSRHGGVSEGEFASLNLGYSTEDHEPNVAANRAMLLETLGVEPDRVFSGWLSHGSAVSEFHSPDQANWPIMRRPIRVGSTRVEAMFRSDGVVSDVPGLHFLLTFADCVPILFADTGRSVIGAAHAGWRGTAAGVGAAVVRSMCRSFSCLPNDIVAVVGPSIGPCCYTVGPSVADEFRRHGAQPALRRRGSQRVLDLWESNVNQLRDAGLRPEAIEVAGVCTSCHADSYFSHRAAGGKTGRFAACIGIP